jgi:GcvH upstream region-like protein
MLSFFRKHQRIFFTVITVVVILSFSFFGTFSVLQNLGEKKKDKLLTRAVDGSKIYESDIKKMANFLNSDRDQDPTSASFAVNLLNDGVIRKDFLETGIASLIAKEYGAALLPKMSTQWDKIKRFHSYQHPHASFLSASNLWERFAPKLKENLTLLKAKDAFSLEEFSLLSNLYLEQVHFPASALKRWVAFQQRQYPEIPFDQRLYHDDFTLFGFHTISDWFSQDFLELASEFIWNCASVAEKEGIHVSANDAKVDLWKNFASYMQETFSQEKLTDATLSAIFQRQLNTLGLHEKTAVDIWRKILLFRKLLDSKTAGIHLDTLADQEMNSSEGMRAVVEAYSLPKAMQLQTMKDVLLLQMYLKAVSPMKDGALSLPKDHLPIAKIKESYPSLVKGGISAKIAHVNKEEVGLRIAVKELWQWQLEDAHFKELTEEFAALSSKGDRFSALKKADKALREKIDAFSVAKMLEMHPEWTAEALEQKPHSLMEINLASLQSSPLPGIKRNEELISLLEDALDPAQKSAREKLKNYTQDGKTFYNIEVKGAVPEQVISFEEARSLKIIDSALDEYLEKEYPKVRSKASKKFKDAEGEWKSFEDVKEELAELVFADLFKAVEKTASQEGHKNYALARFEGYLSEARNGLSQNPQSSEFLADEKEANLFNSQWKLSKRLRTLSQKDLDYSAFELALSKEGDWAGPNPKSAEAGLIHVIKKEKDPNFDPLEGKRGAIQIESKRLWAEKALHDWNELKAVVYPSNV